MTYPHTKLQLPSNSNSMVLVMRLASALQLRVSLAYLNNLPPIFSILQLYIPSFHVHIVHPRRFPFSPATEVDYLVSEQFSF